MKTCFVCGKELSFFGVSNNKKILKCSNCGMGYTVGAATQKGKYHRDETYIEEENLFKNIFQKRVNRILRLKKTGKVLEIGCSTGLMLALFKEKGWEVAGVEVSQKAAPIAAKRGIPVFIKPFETINFQEKFDVIVFNHTLEHLKDPEGAIKKAQLLLNKGGLIYIDLPNFGSLSAKIYGINWPMLLPDEHLWHFTLKSLRILLNKSDFKVVYVERASGIWDYNSSLKGMLISLISFKKRFFTELLTSIPSWVVWKLGMGSDLMVIAKKV